MPQEANNEDEGYMNQFLHFFLNSHHFEEWISSMQPDKTKMFVFFESQKAKHAHNFETMELYV